MECASESWSKASKFMGKVGMVANASHYTQLGYFESKGVLYLLTLDGPLERPKVEASVLQ
jgi:hypothetical protein